MITRMMVHAHMEGPIKVEVADIAPHGYSLYIDDKLRVIFRHKRDMINFKNSVTWAVDNACTPKA